jgi:hypothetical protein
MRDTIRKSSNRYGKPRATARISSAADLRMAAARLQTADALKHNTCPTCGGPVGQNLSITGWVQCAQFGAPAFRMNPLRAACPWQGFTV